MHNEINKLFKEHFSPDPFLLTDKTTVGRFTQYLKNRKIEYLVESKKPWNFINNLNNSEFTHVLLPEDSNKIYGIKGTIKDLVGDAHFCEDDTIELIAVIEPKNNADNQP